MKQEQFHTTAPEARNVIGNYLKRYHGFLQSIIKSEVFSTILSGVILFIASQYILELIIKPRVRGTLEEI